MQGKVQHFIQVKLNERNITVPQGATLLGIRNLYKPDADVVIYNGYPLTGDIVLKQGDEIVLIKKGEIPTPEEFETMLMARHTPGIHEIIRKAVVGIAGLGGLGSAVAIALVRTGVGTLILADYDIVEPSNLNRQQYFIHQIGMRKVDAIRENLLKINPYVNLSLHPEKIDSQNVAQIFGEADVLVEALDRAEEKAAFINSVTEKMPDKYVIAASGVAGYGENNEIKTIRFSSKIYVVGDQKTAAKPGIGLMAPRVGIAAHHQANTVLRILLGEEK